MLIKKGTLIHEEKPFIHVLSSKLKHVRCDHCFTKSELHKCSGCKYVSYCGRDCQKGGWLDHKTECANLKRVCNGRDIPNAARLLARIIFKLKRGGGGEQGWYDKNKFRIFRDLMSHYPQIKEDAKRSEHLISLAGVLRDFMGQENLPNPAELMGLYGRMVINGFNILDHDMESIGTGIYLGASTIDHSCRPNAIAVFNGIAINIRLLVDIPDFEWSKVRISYIDLIKTTTERQQELRVNYYFDCNCAKCTDSELESLASSLMCPNPTCQQPVPTLSLKDNGLKLKCLWCDTVIPKDLCKSFLEVMELTLQQHLDMKYNGMAYIDVCQVCLSRQQDIFHPLNLLYVKTLDLAYESALRLGKFEFCESIGEALALGFKTYLGETHPLLGLHYLSWGKILLYHNKPREAVQILEQGDELVQITYGKEHPFYRREVCTLVLEAKIAVQSLNDD